MLEATGNYSSLLVYLLSQVGITVSLENPLKIKNFARVMLSVTKTDETDARLIALYGEKMQPAPYRLRSDAILTLKQKRTVIRQLKKQLIATRNLKGSMEALPFFDPKCKKAIERQSLSLKASQELGGGTGGFGTMRVQETDGLAHLYQRYRCHAGGSLDNGYGRLHVL